MFLTLPYCVCYSLLSITNQTPPASNQHASSISPFVLRIPALVPTTNFSLRFSTYRWRLLQLFPNRRISWARTLHRQQIYRRRHSDIILDSMTDWIIVDRYSKTEHENRPPFFNQVQNKIWGRCRKKLFLGSQIGLPKQLLETP